MAQRPFNLLDHFVKQGSGSKKEGVSRPSTLNQAMAHLYHLKALFFPTLEHGDEAVIHGKAPVHCRSGSSGQLLYKPGELPEALKELFGDWLGTRGVVSETHPETLIEKAYVEFWIHLIPEPDKHGGSLEKLLEYSFRPPDLP